MLQILALALLVAPLVVHAKEPAKGYSIGWLSAVALTPETKRNSDFFEQRLRELGYVEGKNLLIERRYSEGRHERLRDLAAELVRLNVDVIVAGTTPAVQAAQKATSKIPIVMVSVTDPVGSGFVASLARPGGNVTGLSLLYVELSGKRLQLLKEAIPAVTRVAVLWNPANRGNLLQLEHSKATARTLGLRLQLVEVRGTQDIEGVFVAATKEQAGVVVVLDDPLLFVHQARIATLAAENRLPSISGLPAFAEAGGLMSYGPDFRSHVGQAASYVAKILRGAKPGDLPVEQSAKFELVVNLKTAQALGLTIPPSVLLRADRIIE